MEDVDPSDDLTVTERQFSIIGLAKIVHKPKATACGGARRDHGVTGSWAEVTCSDGLAKMPGRIPVQCRSCRRPVLGRCIHWQHVDVWFHDVCAGPFERTAAPGPR
jgi:hypothetical protein